MAERSISLTARPLTGVAICALLAVLAAPVSTVQAAPSIGGCPVFPANNVWNTDISSLPAHPSSASWIGSMGGPSRLLHPDFGSSGDPAAPYGIPFNVVDSSHPRVTVNFDYSAESDHVGYPFGADTSIEGGAAASGDRHAIMVDRSSCTLYELYDAHFNGAASTAGSGATWSLGGNALRPATWTSADAAGLPIFPGLLRLDEVQSGSVQHAIRFTAQQTDRSFLWPARHQAGAAANPALPPMGARFRLRAGFDIAAFSPATRAVLTAMKHYGLILADNGSNWYFQGAADNGWSDTMITELKRIPAGQFDAVDESSLMIDPNSAQARQPATPAVRAPLPAPAVPVPPAVVAAPVVSHVSDAMMMDPESRRPIEGRVSVAPVAGAVTNSGGASKSLTMAAWVAVVIEIAGLGVAAWLWSRHLLR